MGACEKHATQLRKPRYWSSLPGRGGTGRRSVVVGHIRSDALGGPSNGMPDVNYKLGIIERMSAIRH